MSVEEVAPHVHGYVVAIQGADGSSALYTPSSANVANQGRATDPMGSGAPHNHGIALDGTHAHNVSVSQVGDHTHTATVTDARPPFYALAYILKL